MVTLQNFKRLFRKSVSMSLALLILISSVFCGNFVITADALSQGQQNIVKRAYQMTDIKWTPQKDVYGWNSAIVYKAGTTYTGLPYGQPVYASYIPWNTSLEDFIAAVNDKNSKMYTDFSSYNKRAPYYSTDCSAFVAWAWGLSKRQTTSSIKSFSTQISTSSYANAQVGDCLCLAGNHVVLITDITYGSDNQISSIEISEATTNKNTYYCCQKTRYGEGGQYSLDKLSEKYFGKGYILYRSKTRDTVTYTHSCVVPLEGDKCEKCKFGYEALPCEHTYSSGVTKEPTCIENGMKTYTCSKCNEFYTDNISPTGHSFENGSCVNCGEPAPETPDTVIFDASFILRIFDFLKKVFSELIKLIEDNNNILPA